MRAHRTVILMPRVVLAAACLLLPAGASSASPAEFTDSFMIEQCRFSDTGTNPFFILQPGYQLTFEGDEGKVRVHLTVKVLNDTRLVNGVKTRVVEERETNDGDLVEVSRNYFAICAPSNTVFYFGEEVDLYEDGVIVGHEGSWLAGENGARAGVMMPGIQLLGARYFQEVAPKVAMDRAETVGLNGVVSTPAGTFTNVLEVQETTPLEPGTREYKLYAPGVGLVQDGGVKLVEASKP